MAIDFDKQRGIEQTLLANYKEAMAAGLQRELTGGRDDDGIRGMVRSARDNLRRQVSRNMRQGTGCPYFEFEPGTTGPDMLVEFERERTRLETFPPPQRGAYEVGAPLATIRSDITTAGRVIELEQQAAALQSEMDRLYADLTPLRQLVNAMQRYTGVSNSTIANMSRGA